MLVTLKEILDQANSENYAVPAPDIFTELDARACIEAAEEKHSPLILSIAPRMTKDLAFTAGIATALAEQASVPVAVHLDHGKDLAQIRLAIESGMTSVMIDGSALPLEENIRLVKEAVAIAGPSGVSVEAEIGHVAQAVIDAEEDTDDCSDPGDCTVSLPDQGLTVPEEAAVFIRQTGIDACAVAIGTVHGTYKGTPHLDFDCLAKIKERAGIPLVLHGSSGTGEENIRKVCRMGINKVNVCNDILQKINEDLRSADLSGNAVYGLWAVVMQSVHDFMIHEIDVTGSAGKS